MNHNDDKPTEVLNELEGVREILDDEEKLIPILDEQIPEFSITEVPDRLRTVPESHIPELNERIEIN